MQKANIFVGALTVLFGITILYLSGDMRMFDEYGVPGERFRPYGLAWLFIGLGVLQWVQVVVNRLRQAPDVTVKLASPQVLRAYLVALIMLIYSAMLYYLGFIIASLLLVPFIMWMMGEKRPWFLALVSAAIVAAIYLFFEVIFNSPLPVSVFVE